MEKLNIGKEKVYVMGFNHNRLFTQFFVYEVFIFMYQFLILVCLHILKI